MSVEPIITLRNVSKTFHVREQAKSSLRDAVFGLFKPAEQSRSIEALKDINFEIYPGEFVGIIGRNGSGKSTLLKVILGTLQPDKGGVVEVDGVVIRLALGMGFDGNLSARDNIYLNGSIIGLSFKKIGSLFDEIIGFAELEEYVDTPVKFFSSGMRSRLAFSIAVHAEADILLIDEFFGGVGDIGFKAKSDKVFRESILKNRTIIYVSHQLPNIRLYCKRVFVVHKGELTEYNNPDDAIESYRNMVQNSNS